MPRYDTGWRARSQVISGRPDYTGWRYLESDGHVDGLVTTDTMPGGNETLTCTLQVTPRWRSEALDPGRIIRVVRGASVQWEGVLEEPAPDPDGWHLTATGAGSWGKLWRAVFSTFTADAVIDGATGRGLNWVKGTVSGGFLSDVRDSGSMNVGEFLNLYTSPGSKTWRVKRTFAGNQVDVFTVPATPTRLLVASVPPTRTLAGYVNALCIRYQVTADNSATNTPATYATTYATLPASITKHGRQEDSWDLTTAGVMTASAAQALGNTALAKYTAASWGGPFTVTPGQYLTMGGAPVDLATEHAGEVARLILADGPYGGEVSPAPPVQFPVGKFEYHDADGTAIVTPFQYAANDLASLLTLLTPKPPA